MVMIAAEISDISSTTRRERHSERGGARLKTLIWVVLAVALVFCTIKILPPYISNYQLEDWLKSEVLFTLGKPLSNDSLTEAVVKELKSLDIDAGKDNVHILQNDSRGVRIQVDYTVNVDLKFYQLQLHFTPEANNQSLVQ
jgi:hypothetical protein